MTRRAIDQQSIDVSNQGYLSIIDKTDNYTAALDYDGSNNLIYQGKAAIGSGKAAAVWQIKKFTYDSSNNLTDIQWAGGKDGFTSIWNNRAGLSYS